MPFSSLLKRKDDTWGTYFSFLRYSLLRRIHPRYREQYRLEILVGPQGCWEQLKQYQFNILTGLGLKPEHALLDIGCGPLTVGIKLIPHLNSGNYVGVDLRPQPLVEGYRLIAKHALVQKNPTLIYSATFGKDELVGRSFDYIWLSQLSYHFDNKMMEDLFALARSRMKPDSVFLFDVLDPARTMAADAHWSGFSFHVRPFEYYAELANSFGFSVQSRGQIGDFGYPEHSSNLKTNLLLEVRVLPGKI